MPKTDIKLYSTDAGTGSKITTSVSYVNPNASNAVLKSFGQQLNALTTNGYVQTDRIETINVDTDESRKMFRDITVTGAVQGATATVTMNINEGETSKPAAFFWTESGTTLLTVTTVQSDISTVGKFTVSIPNSSGSLYLGQIAKNNFYADFVAVNL